MSILLFLVASLTCISTPSTSVYALTVAEIFNAEFEDKMNSNIGVFTDTSFSMAIINDTEIVYAGGFGAMPGNDTVYQLGSLSKLFTATAVMQLYEDGLIDLEADVNDYLPYNFSNPYYPAMPIKVKYLLSHTGTMKNSETYWEIVFNGTYAFEDMFYELLNESGSEYGDSWRNAIPGGTEINFYQLPNIEFDLLAYVVEIITGKDFETYVTDNILTPLGMTNTRLDYNDYDPSKLPPALVFHYYRNYTIAHRNYDGRGSVGWRTTIEDYVKFLYTFLNGEYESTSLLNETSINLMLTDNGGYNGYGFFLGGTVSDIGNITVDGLNTNAYALPLPGSFGCFGMAVLNKQKKICAVTFSNSHIFKDDYLSYSDKMLNTLEYALIDLIYGTCSTCTTKTSLFFIPVISTISILTVITMRKKKK